MKKAIKGLIVASAVAAVVGVGAVSYAAWSGSTDTSVTINNGLTGQIATVGAITVTADGASCTDSENPSLTTLKKLCPVDQTNSVPTDCVKYWKFTLSTAATGGQSVKYQIKGGLTKGADADNGTALGSAALKFLTGTTAPTAATEGTALDATTACTAFSDTTVYIFLKADNTEAMNAKITVTFEAVEG